MTAYQFGDILLKLVLALVCGGIIGLERERRKKSAGLRTNILICMGSALVMMVSIDMALMYKAFNVDPTRIAASIITGIGFLGAGTIMQQKQDHMVEGLTSAATIWVVAAIGMTIGAGMYIMALTAALLTVATLWGISRFKEKIKRTKS